MSVKKAKPTKAKPKTKKAKAKEKSQLRATVLRRLIAETLQNNSEGEFILPSFLTEYLDKNHPKYELGIHREFYIPVASEPRFVLSDDPEAMGLYLFQAEIILPAILGEGIRIKEEEYDNIPLCEDCDA